MSISATCPGCGKVIAAPPSAAGHRARCPQCGRVVEFFAGPAAAPAMETAAGGATAHLVSHPAAAAAALETLTPSPTPSRSGSSLTRASATTIDRMLARTSPYGSLRLLAAIVFGMGLALAAIAFIGGLALLIILSTGGQPWPGVGVFLGLLLAAMLLLLGGRLLSEILRLWADVGDRARQTTQMLEELLNRSHDLSI